jgi:tetraacyldisaccharide 4'-kinase
MTLLESFYYLGYTIKKRHALKNQKRLPSKVISIGNITLGGTGKTPAVMALAEEAKKRGINPCILTRGYKGKAQGPCFVSTGKEPLLDESLAGDEAFLMAVKLRGIPVIKGKDRYKAGMFAIQNLASQPLFILDDGFQHWKLYRDKNILLLDNALPFGNGKLLPLGTLREPVKAIVRADIIVITKTAIGNQHPLEDNLIKEIRLYNKEAHIFTAEHIPKKFMTRDDDTMPLEWAKGKSFFGFCGIGDPQSFKKTLLSIDIPLTGFRAFRDHHRYSQKDIQSIVTAASRSGAEWIVTTEKDIMRLKGLSMPEHLVSLGIAFHVDTEFYNEVFKDHQ